MRDGELWPKFSYELELAWISEDVLPGSKVAAGPCPEAPKPELLTPALDWR